MVAKDFGKKETWMYDYCKNQFGETFSSKLQSFRLSKAKELLAQTELSIEEISIQIGYGNSHSFRRAFKRVFGITPAEYREFIGKENKE
ncbi:MAG: AraC family transcriptional regulator [Rectinema sp.]